MKFFILIIFLLCACSTNPPLTKRGLPNAERQFFIIQNGWGLSQEIKSSFKAGLPCLGMQTDLIFNMYGSPDFVQKVKLDPDNGQIMEYKWSYYNVKKTKGWTFDVILEFIFDEDGNVIEIIGEPCKANASCE